MIRETHPRQELSAAAKLAQSLTLVQIRPQRISFENRLPKVGENQGDALNLKVTLSHAGEKSFIREGFLDILIPTSVRFFSSETAEDTGAKNSAITDQDSWVVNIETEFLITFSTPPGPVPKSIAEFNIPAFAKSTALTIAWPYIRHHLDHLASASSIPFVMPILCIDAVEEDVPEGAE